MGEPSGTVGRWVLATYNVHAWRGTDGRYDADRTTEVIRSLRADVVGLQEVTLDPDGAAAIGRRYLEEATGMQVVVGRTLKRGEADFGNVLLTSLPVRAVRRHDLTVSRDEPRGLVDVDLELEGSTLRVLSTHFGKGVEDRRRQARQVADLLEEPPRDAVVLMGDINEWLPGWTCLGILNRRLGSCAAHPTYPSWLPVLKLDRIWVRPHELLSSYRVVRSDAARKASDHLPLCAELRRR